MSVQENTQTEQPSAPAPQEGSTTVSFDQPVVPENTEAAQPETDPSVTPADEGQQNERDEKGRFKGVQPRIDELTRARREAEREASYWRGIATQGQAQNSAPAATQKPTPDQYDDYGKYVEDLTDWKAEQAVAKRMEQDSSRKVVATRNQTFAERQEAVRALLPDYIDVVGGSDTPIAENVSESLLDSERGPELAYHLAKNPDILIALNSMSPKQADRELGKLEASLPVRTVPAVPSKKLSNTPAPASTQSTQGRATTPALANASMDEYIAQRKSQGARWA